VTQCFAILFPGELKSRVHSVTSQNDITWSEFKLLADGIVANLATSGVTPYAPTRRFGTALSWPKTSQPQTPETPFTLKKPVGSTVKAVEHQVESTKSTTTTTGIQIVGTYVPIKESPKFTGKQNWPCFNCKSDIPQRHYYRHNDVKCSAG
jgi:hypothetical protein